jgi:hypothetical protein
MARKVARQPKCWPMAVPIGAPRIIARLKPSATLATAEACRPAGASDAAVTTAMAKKVATTDPLTARAASRTA